MNLADTVLAFATDYTVKRRGPTLFGSDGKADAPSVSTMTVKAMVHPASGEDLLRLPEGRRADRVVAAFTVEALRTAGAGAEADLIVVDGQDFEVQHVESWDSLGAFWRSVAMRVGP